MLVQGRLQFLPLHQVKGAVILGSKENIKAQAKAKRVYMRNWNRRSVSIEKRILEKETRTREIKVGFLCQSDSIGSNKEKRSKGIKCVRDATEGLQSIPTLKGRTNKSMCKHFIFTLLSTPPLDFTACMTFTRCREDLKRTCNAFLVRPINLYGPIDIFHTS